MPKLVLPYEIKPYVVSQKWGRLDPDTYSQFGFTRHNGEDVILGKNGEVRAPFPYTVTSILWQPHGGGKVIGITSRSTYDAPDGQPANVQVYYLHLKETKKKVGDTGEIGDILAIADNTGFSTGPHTHIAPKWVRRKGVLWVNVEANDANNTFDPAPYRDGTYAESYATISILTKMVSALKQLVGIKYPQKP